MGTYRRDETEPTMQGIIPWIPVAVSALNLATAAFGWAATRHRKEQREARKDDVQPPAPGWIPLLIKRSGEIRVRLKTLAGTIAHRGTTARRGHCPGMSLELRSLGATAAALRLPVMPSPGASWLARHGAA